MGSEKYLSKSTSNHNKISYQLKNRWKFLNVAVIYKNTCSNTICNVKALKHSETKQSG